MRRLVQKVFDINPGATSNPDRLQRYLDKKSSEGWEYCGQIGLFYVFKRWEEIPNVVDGGNNYGQAPYFGGSQYRPPQSFQPYNPYSPNNYTPQYKPQQWGVKVNESDDDKYNSNPFDE